MNKQSISLTITCALLFLFTLSVFVYWYKARTIGDMVIADDVAHLAAIFNTIDQDCGIVSFEHQNNNINFLNVISFAGSEVGPMNLKHPKKWRGAYLKDNPTIQEKYYQVVATKKGYYVVPGTGVRLASGKIIGKDIVVKKDTDLETLIQTDLHFKGKPLATRIPIGTKQHKQLDSFKEKITRDRLRGM